MPDLKTGELLHGFLIESITPLKEYRGTGIYLKHIKTGCEVFHLLREDPENLFAFVFKTPAVDNTGVAHIMEHSVLSGSERYPVKDPFLALMKGSMNTFLNAMTYPDKTVYPASSTVEKDYFNIMRVYGDAVFFPLLKEEVFLQEGRRFEPDPESGGYKLDGVVYNEMQGAYSSHDTIVNEWSYRHLFPGSPYYYDSGGEPLEIPRLTYQEFIDYHKKYYHPSNCRIFLYGDINTGKQLQILNDEFLDRFEAGEKIGQVPLTSHWDEPKRFFMTSSMADDPEGIDHGDGDRDGGSGKSTITINWKTSSITRPEDILSMEILSEMLLGNMGSPLYKILTESDIGEDVAPSSGLDTEIRESVFSVGIRGAEPDSADSFENLVMSTLRQLADEGIPEDVLRGALHQVEFRNREIRGGIPFGLRLMDKSLRGWLHDSLPWETMNFAENMEKIKKHVDENPGYFNDLIRKQFIDNNHRTTLVVTPSAEHDAGINKALEGLVSELTGNNGSKLSEELVEKSGIFHTYQEEQDPPEVQDLIPTLHRKDLPRDISLIDTSINKVDGIPFYFHDLYTHGIIYIDLAFDVRGFDRTTSSYLPMFTRLVTSSGLPGLTYDQVARQLSMVSGGIYTFLESSPVIGTDEEREYIFFRLKVLERDLEPAFELLENMLLNSLISDPARIRDLLFEHRNDFKSSILPMGHSLSALRGASKIARGLTREEAWRGIEQYFFLDSLIKQMKNSGGNGENIGRVMENIRKRIFTRDRLLINITGPESALAPVRNRMSLFASRLPEGIKTDLVSDPREWEVEKFNEGLIFPAAVGFSARLMPAALAGTFAHSCELLLGHYLKTNLLWERIRMKGGAYGVSSSANGAEGLFSFTSYRDPNPGRSLEEFRNSLTWMAENEVSVQALEKTVIGVVGKDARPLSPGEKSMMGFRRDLYGVTDAIRRKNRENLLKITPGDLKKAAADLLANWDRGVSVYLAGDEMAGKIEGAEGSPEYRRTELPG